MIQEANRVPTLPTVTLAFSDGAIRGGYVAGVFFGLKEYLPELWPKVKVLTASSASIGGVLYEIAYGKDNPGKRLWTEDFTDSNLIKLSNLFKGHPPYDIDYLVDTIFTRNNPLTLPPCSEWPYDVYFPLIESKTGATLIFNNRFQRPYNITTNTEYILINPAYRYELIRAACAALVLYDKPVNVGGRWCIDAGFRHPFIYPDSAIQTTHALIISTEKFKTRLNFLILNLIKNLYQLGIKKPHPEINKELYNELGSDFYFYQRFLHQLDYPQHRQQIYYLYPHHKLGGIFDNSKQILAHNFRVGHNDARDQQHALRAFLQQPPKV